jgi:hypothetical protein
MPSVLRPDPFNAVLLSSPALLVTEEQKQLIKKVLDKSSSDSLFSDKAYAAIAHILSAGITVPPVISTLTPNSAELGDPSFVLHVHGTGFKTGSIIVFAGVEEPTTVVSPTELTTGVNMAVWVGPDSLPVYVLNPDGVQSDPMMFTFTDGVAAATLTPTPVTQKPTTVPVKK